MTTIDTAHTAQESGEQFRRKALDLLAKITARVEGITFDDWGDVANVNQAGDTLEAVARFLGSE